MDSFRVIFTFTREKEPPVHSDHPRVIYAIGRFFNNQDGTKEILSKYYEDLDNIDSVFNPIYGSSSFINGTVTLPDGKIERGNGIKQNFEEIEGVRPDKMNVEQNYLQQTVAGDK
ncbi:MAG: hypothetical protein L0H53_08105 [Candidatus Nitrosocosmicus sp.]|nr:hypothetical protein [Candidatus Nitrosocosmicus sp.]MDN5867669.1 hypothetical protein [Candidatus Nitrosocosmicus sp.]